MAAVELQDGEQHPDANDHQRRGNRPTDHLAAEGRYSDGPGLLFRLHSSHRYKPIGCGSWGYNQGHNVIFTERAFDERVDITSRRLVEQLRVEPKSRDPQVGPYVFGRRAQPASEFLACTGVDFTFAEADQPFAGLLANVGIQTLGPATQEPTPSLRAARRNMRSREPDTYAPSRGTRLAAHRSPSTSYPRSGT